MADYLKVDEVLSNLDVKEDMMAVEFGCGFADFTIAMAKKLSKGKVYALDIQEEKLSALKSKLELEKIYNVTMMVCDLEATKGSTLQDGYVDVVLIPNVLFQAENKYAMIEEGIRILKHGGQLLVVDWVRDAPFGPKEGTITPEEVKKVLEKSGFSLKKELAAGDYHYALLFTK